MKLKFNIDNQGEIGAGIIGFTDTVTVEIESGDPGGELGDFADYIQECLAEWYDGARIKLVDVPETDFGGT